MDAVLQTMVDEKIGPGERRKQFLKLMAEYLGLKDGIAVRSYTDALKAAITSLCLESGDSIAVSVLSPEIYRTVINVYYILDFCNNYKYEDKITRKPLF